MGVTTEFNPADYRRLLIRECQIEGRVVSARYSLIGSNGADDVEFAETFDFGGIDSTVAFDPRLLRLLALTAGVSYYKASAPETVSIDFPITESEAAYVAAVIRGGLGEFAFENQLPDALTPMLDYRLGGDVEIAAAESAWTLDAEPLVAVGGGKDSVVSIEALKAAGRTPTLFSVNRYQPIEDCIAVSGLSSVHVLRKIDRTLIELNGAGAYNGHIPVTAINSVIALIAADVAGLGSVVMSNEQSADIENLSWHGFEINHQWSKSREYENLLRSMLADYGMDPARYFSLLRGLPESDIADLFRGCTAYFDVFVSCNRSFALDESRRRSRWCGECPKCLFVFVLLAPRIGRDRLCAIFAQNVLDNDQNTELFLELAGLTAHKPFECVGDYSEVAEAFVDLMDDSEWSDDAVVRRMADDRTRLMASAANRVPVAESENIPAPYAGVLGALVSR
ncbi:hypothetical protein SAMN04488550_1663 [Gordonia malaquae]|uniref:UDP-N-acetyl-alpha-D-muramoyl-L-alanyl-L-glutamate epimerase n=1 Tax=Gordonia malaquae NBRC 108250 TaxID=1223542 RepID=M3UWL1_GORML|nr:hypothetical protein [Gordonia malaquae]GAC80037.1 hypothetical protein GM1_014_00290 [Gordonia malaquae NBRC 108250]SEC33789.1 hypothetical protein SAMN04488550_1663 [Gordonia malaquae]